MKKQFPNLVRHRTRFVVARNDWCAQYKVRKIKSGLLKPHGNWFLTRDEALMARNNLRSIFHSTHSVFEVDIRD